MQAVAAPAAVPVYDQFAYQQQGQGQQQQQQQQQQQFYQQAAAAVAAAAAYQQPTSYAMAAKAAAQYYPQQQQQHQQMQMQHGVGGAGVGVGGGAGGAGMIGCVVMVTGIVKSEEALVHLYNLFSFFGNITRIKFLNKKENVAVIEFTSVEEAANAVNLTRGMTAFGIQLQVAVTKFPNIQLSQNDPHGKDFGSLRLHRYPNGPRSPQYLGVVCAPTAKLHLAYLHGYTEAAVYDLFNSVGTVITVNFLVDNPTIGFVTMSNINDACTAICVLHNRPNPFDENQRPLKVSFAKK